jgi:hypothetical protein
MTQAEWQSYFDALECRDREIQSKDSEMREALADVTAMNAHLRKLMLDYRAIGLQDADYWPSDMQARLDAIYQEAIQLNPSTGREGDD